MKLKIRIQRSSHELTFASKNRTIIFRKYRRMFSDDVTANELFSSFEL